MNALTLLLAACEFGVYSAFLTFELSHDAFEALAFSPSLLQLNLALGDSLSRVSPAPQAKFSGAREGMASNIRVERWGSVHILLQGSHISIGHLLRLLHIRKI